MRLTQIHGAIALIILGLVALAVTSFATGVETPDDYFLMFVTMMPIGIGAGWAYSLSPSGKNEQP